MSLKRGYLQLLIWLLGGKRLIKAVSNKATDDWCFRSADDQGWRSYYQNRHTNLTFDMTRRLLERDKYLINYGRLWELETLRSAMELSVQKQKEKGAYKTKRQKKVKIR